VILAVEDPLSEAIARKIVSSCGVQVSVVLGRKGNGYLRNKARELNRAASEQSILLLTDLDSARRCPVTMRDTWVGAEVNPRFLFRVAVMEVEAWVLAHREAFGAFASVAAGRIPIIVDEIADPKLTLVNLCRSSTNARLRASIVPRNGSTAVVGPDYNGALTAFVDGSWKPEEAGKCSPSLVRTLNRVCELVAKFPQ
jgi:hypothetical protein